MSEFKPNEKLYKRLSKPYESQEEAAKAIKAFTEAVSKLRRKHKIAEVVMGVGVYVEGGGIAATWQCGDRFNGANLAEFLSESLTKELSKDLIDKSTENK